MTEANRFRDSPQFKDGRFQNASPTPLMTSSGAYVHALLDMLHRPSTLRPNTIVPSQKTSLIELYQFQQPVVVWFGHSSYCIRFRGMIYAGGKNILVDPVFSGYASPVTFFIRAFAGSDVLHPEDMPPIDLLVITHNHYDHLDVKTLAALAPGVKKVLTALGVGELIAECGIPPHVIVETDWWDTVQMDNLHFTAAPSRHFSGRGFRRGGSLWNSFSLKVDDYAIYVGGDSGYDQHFQEIGERHGADIGCAGCTGGDREPYAHLSSFPRKRGPITCRFRTYCGRSGPAFAGMTV